MASCSSVESLAHIRPAGRKGEWHAVYAHLPHPYGPGNSAVKDGSITDILQSIEEDLKPEAMYFADIESARGGYVVVEGHT
jgi:hypothetical protein